MRLRTGLTAAVVASLALVGFTASASTARPERPVAAGATYPLAQTFLLHSLPGSQHTIYLDFDGVTVAPGSWSDTQLSIAPGSYGGFTLDGSAAFSAYEQDFIQQVWRRVAEMYAPFDVDVTTQDPGSDAVNKTSAGDNVYGVQVAFTGNSVVTNEACGSCAGTAPLDTFGKVATTDRNNPAWVFTRNTFPSTTYIYSSSLTAAAAAHEAGHTFGLVHDATAGDPTYYPGHGSWFPIMGQSEGTTPLGQWSKGEYAGANNTEDDLAKIAADVGLRADDHPNRGSGSVTELGSKASYTASGLISTDADTDYFRFTRTCAGPMTVRAAGIGAGQTLDIKLVVYSSTGTVLGTSDPGSGKVQVGGGDPWWRSTGLDAALSFGGAGTVPYYVTVEGTGFGNPLNTGYSGYGSLGKYALTISDCTKAPVPVVTRPGAPRIGTATSGAAGGSLTAVARWAAPTSTGNTPITAYRVQAVKVAGGKVTKTYTFGKIAATNRQLTIGLPAGTYRFRVVAYNKIGNGAYSAYSNLVAMR